MSIFDDEESIVLRKAIERDREWQKKTSNNPFDYSRISNNAQARLEYSDDQRNREVIDATMSFGPAAIQKIGNGQVFGKLAKAVRKVLAITSNGDAKASNLKPVSIFKIDWKDASIPRRTKYVTNFFADIKQPRKAIGLDDFDDIGAGSITQGIARNEIGFKPSYNIIENSLPQGVKGQTLAHELGHQVTNNKIMWGSDDIKKLRAASQNISTNGQVGYGSNISELGAETFFRKVMSDKGMSNFPAKYGLADNLDINAYNIFKDNTDMYKNISYKLFKGK